MYVRAAGVALATVISLALASAGVAEEPGVEVTLERTLEATADDIRTNAPQWVEEIREALKVTLRLDEAARRSRAGEGLDCLTTNIESLRTLASVSESALKSIEEALSRGDQARASFEYRKIAIASKSSKSLQLEAERCALGEGLRDGATRRDLTGSPTNPADETLPIPNDPTEWAFDPPDASPF
jgi:hypothetical protein